MNSINKIGIIGAGVMGIGVAHDCALHGIDSVLIDVSEDILDKAKINLKENIRLYGMLRPNLRVENIEQILDRICYSTDLNSLSSHDFIIENVTESWDIKYEVYKKLEEITQPNCIIAANTSAISITKISGALTKKDRVLGIHFMNPVPLKKSVEVIKGYHTSEETLSITRSLLAKIDKEAIVVNDWPGFVSNRVLMLTINEAVYLLQDQVATARDVDRIFKECFEHKMGPLETADMIGLDTILMSIQVLYESFSDSKYRPCPLLVKMVDAGKLGRKSRSGFYDY